ncbi:Ubiquitin carboxyl-terminal hydrolase putative [Candida maltosa Xu316]|uniref:ubiquitinyl hydrolase 1 n=1 Tax=Candida maltosa (strain Xu316) TaxID=1245528 RepID=M3JYZ4_CANMX|nr:Ubiquitin carboxyl-terminal hydrolase putative [Candida maltosa Xu316]
MKNTNESKPQNNNNRISISKKKEKERKSRPKSLHEAIAKYTNNGNTTTNPTTVNTYLTRSERKRKRKLEEKSKPESDQDDEREEVPEQPEEEQEAEEVDEEERVIKKSKGMWGTIKSFWSGSSNSSTPTPTSFESTDEDLGEDLGEDIGEDIGEEIHNDNEEVEDESSPGEVYAETSPFTGFSETDKSEVDDNGDDNDDDDEEDDADFTAQSDDEDNDEDDDDDDSEDSGENSKEDSVSGSDEDEDLEKLKHDLKVDELVNANSNTNDDEEDDEDEDKAGLEEPGTSATPPTSPEEEEEVEDNGKELEYYDFNEYYEDRGSNGSNRIYKNWRELQDKKPPVGLLNHGVTCYMNSAIQSLLHIPALQHYLNDVYDKKVDNLKPRSITHVLAELSKRMWSGDKKYINPKKIISRLDDINCMMSEWQQEDSHEYYMSLMSRLQEDSTPKGKKLNESILYDIFGGLLKQRITCHKCHNVSITDQEFYDLSLGLNRKKFKNSNKFSVEKSINEFFSNELIKKNDEENKSGYYCENCKKFTHANKISTIKTAPETLTIHFKRFKFNNNSSSKVKQSINYSKFLNLNKYMEDKTESCVYKLISVIVHEGRSISSGHYISHCLQPDGYTWCTYDDEYINKIEERVALNDPSAYVLVYTKLTPKLEEGSD